MSEKTELKAAAARLLYNSNRSTGDYDMLIDFIDRHFDSVEAVMRELEEEQLCGEVEWYLAFDKAIAIVKRGGRNE